MIYDSTCKAAGEISIVLSDKVLINFQSRVDATGYCPESVLFSTQAWLEEGVYFGGLECFVYTVLKAVSYDNVLLIIPVYA